MASRLTGFIFAALALVGFAGSAQALQFAEISYSDCDSMGCEGSTLYLSVQEEEGGTWLVTYTINTDGYTGDKVGFNQIGFKVIQGWTGGETLSAPVGSLTDWNPVYESPINSSSLCSDSPGNNDMVCVDGFVNITGGGDYTWTFRIEGGTLIEDPSTWHLGGQYANGHYRSRGHILSVTGGEQPVPEPTAAVLFGLGAILVTRSARRR